MWSGFRGSRVDPSRAAGRPARTNDQWSLLRCSATATARTPAERAAFPLAGTAERRHRFDVDDAPARMREGALDSSGAEKHGLRVGEAVEHVPLGRVLRGSHPAGAEEAVEVLGQRRAGLHPRTHLRLLGRVDVPGDRDGDDRQIDVGEEVRPHAVVADDAHHDGEQDQHRREDGPADRNATEAAAYGIPPAVVYGRGVLGLARVVGAAGVVGVLLPVGVAPPHHVREPAERDVHDFIE